MIESVQLIGFRSYENQTFVFDPGVNVIVGETDHGKSSIIWAFEWVAYNRPVNSRMLREDSAEVIVKTSEGDTVSRIKTKTLNEYRLNGKSMKAVGASVPDPVQAALRFSGLTIRHQFDGFFLLSDTNGQRAKFINKLVNIEVIDESLSRIASRLKKENDARLNTIYLLNENKEKLNGYKWIDSADGYLAELETLQQTINQTHRNIQILKTTTENIAEIDKKVAELTPRLQAKDKLASLLVLKESIENRTQKGVRLKQFVLQIRENEKSKERSARIAALKPDLETLKLQQTLCEDLTNEIHLLKKMKINIDLTEKTLTKTKEKLAWNKKEFERLAPEICPFYDQPCPLKTKTTRRRRT